MIVSRDSAVITEEMLTLGPDAGIIVDIAIINELLVPAPRSVTMPEMATHSYSGAPGQGHAPPPHSMSVITMGKMPSLLCCLPILG